MLPGALRRYRVAPSALHASRSMRRSAPGRDRALPIKPGRARVRSYGIRGFEAWMAHASAGSDVQVFDRLQERGAELRQHVPPPLPPTLPDTQRPRP
ncbi:hypothetical protein XFF6992_20058 [Xanthomonas citri pv. fuscans]|nr:hypothetical protein XFF6992_20058 [Xanthomonas citri pv. fuscans]SOO35013.1 hypothetical protein XFF6994_50008 [Xanthomonas citri pv. fuscans]